MVHKKAKDRNNNNNALISCIKVHNLANTAKGRGAQRN